MNTNLQKKIIIFVPVIFLILAGIHLFLDPLGYKPVVLFCKERLSKSGEIFEFNREEFKSNLQGNRFVNSDRVISFNKKKAVYGNSNRIDDKSPNFVEITIDRVTGKLSIFRNDKNGRQFFRFLDCERMHEAKPKF